MLKSMTGYGRNEVVTPERKLTVEMKSVNHRYCDISIKIPKKLSFYEAGIRNVLKQYIGRGKVDVFINYEDYTDNKVCVKYNAELAEEYLAKLTQMSQELAGVENDIRVSILSRYPEVLTLEEQTIDQEELWIILEEAVKGAAIRFVETRITEGENLAKDIADKLDAMLLLVDYIEERAPKILEEHRAKLLAKVTELLGNVKVDESVLLTEVTVFADKICVDEETVRLRSHILNMKDTLKGDNVGRKLDFIAQEMNREANTILSKMNDLDVTNKGIDLKTEIEKIREQIQNIE